MKYLIPFLFFFACYCVASAIYPIHEEEEHPLLKYKPYNVKYLRSTDNGASVSVDPKEGLKNGDYITVTFQQDISKVNITGDFVALFNPGDVDPTEKSPVKYALCSESSEYATTGQGDFRFRLINMRHNYVVYYMTNGLHNPVVLAKSSTIEFSDYNRPLKVHLSTTAIPYGEMKVIWSQLSTTNPIVRYGIDPNDLTSTVEAESTTYSVDDLHGSPATDIGYRDIDRIVFGVMTGLKPKQRYFYQVGEESNTLSPVYSFIYPPISDNPDEKTNIIAFGDMGARPADKSHLPVDGYSSYNTSKFIFEDLKNGMVDSVFHIGDISYAIGFEAEHEWFLDQIEDIASQTPWNINLGNHERDWPGTGSYWTGHDSGGEGGVPAIQLYQTIEWYSVNIGNIHMIMICTEVDFTSGSEQYEWLVNDLKSINRTATPWIILGGHRPMYVDSLQFTPPSGDQPVAQLLRKHLQPLFLQYQVDLGLWGHHHSYQRMCAAEGESCLSNSVACGNTRCFINPSATINMVIGTAGAQYSDNVRPEQPEWCEFVSLTHGYARIQTHNRTHLLFQFINNHNHQVFDEYWIVKS